MADTPQVNINLNRLDLKDLILKVVEYQKGLVAGGIGGKEAVELALSFQQNLLFAQITVMGEQWKKDLGPLRQAARVLLADLDRGEIVPLSEVGDAVTAMVAFHFDDLRTALEENP